MRKNSWKGFVVGFYSTTEHDPCKDTGQFFCINARSMQEAQRKALTLKPEFEPKHMQITESWRMFR
jgi:hypothetical protein